MTNTQPVAVATAGTTPTTTAHPGGRVTTLLGGAALLLAPVLMAGGAWTSPPQDTARPQDYVESLARDPGLTALSAALFHYSWVLFAFGALAAMTLVRGNRGRRLTVVGGLAAAFGSVQLSGLLLSDWFLGGMGRHISLDQAVTVFEEANADPHFAVWMVSAKVGALLGYPVLYAGLARAGVITWWLVPLSLLSIAAFWLVPGAAGIAVGLACYAPAFVTGARLVQRGRMPAQSV
jgi:hypothetical protein